MSGMERLQAVWDPLSTRWYGMLWDGWNGFGIDHVDWHDP
jgi:hypothetical protein